MASKIFREATFIPSKQLVGNSTLWLLVVHHGMARARIIGYHPILGTFLVGRIYGRINDPSIRNVLSTIVTIPGGLIVGYFSETI